MPAIQHHHEQLELEAPTLDRFFAVFAVLIEWPLLALVPAAVFVVLGRLRRSRLANVTGVVWAIYALYELGMRTRVLCAGECNIRVDLLLIYPVLAALTVVAAIALVRARPEPVA